MGRNGSTPGKPPDTPASWPWLVSHVASVGFEPTPHTAVRWSNIMVLSAISNLWDILQYSLICWCSQTFQTSLALFQHKVTAELKNLFFVVYQNNNNKMAVSVNMKIPHDKNPFSPTGSALLHTDLSPLTNGIWEIHAGCSCLLHLQLSAKFG